VALWAIGHSVAFAAQNRRRMRHGLSPSRQRKRAVGRIFRDY